MTVPIRGLGTMAPVRWAVCVGTFHFIAVWFTAEAQVPPGKMGSFCPPLHVNEFTPKVLRASRDQMLFQALGSVGEQASEGPCLLGFASVRTDMG